MSLDSALPQVVVTRPQPEAQAWVDALAQRGVRAIALPLIEIRPSRHAPALASAWAEISCFQAVMFVSASAVRYFFAARPPESCPAAIDAWRAWATGPGTAKALQQAGIPPERIDCPLADSPQLDSEALWAQVKPQINEAADTARPHGRPTRPRRVLIVRGSDAQGRKAGRDWLAQQLSAQGIHVEFAVAYERHGPPWSAAMRIQARQASFSDGGGSAQDAPVWVFSSSEAVANLRQALPDLSWANACAIATHPRIAQAARTAGFGVVCESRPGLDAVLASLASIKSKA